MYDISVIIPTYKRSEFIIRALESVLNQDYNNFEIIIVDDNNNSYFRELTYNKIKPYLNRYNQIKYIKNSKNRGGAISRNIGVRHSNGKYISFLDDDDIFRSNKLAFQYSYMEENNLDMSFSDVIFSKENGTIVEYRSHIYALGIDNNIELLKLHLMHHLTPTSTYMILKTKFLEIGGFEDYKMGQEYMLMLKAIQNNLNIGYIPNAMSVQFLHKGERISIGNTKIDKEIELFQLKKRYFHILNFKQIKYIKYRHNMVLSIVSLRSKFYTKFLIKTLLTFIKYPYFFLRDLTKQLFYRLFKSRKVKL